MPRVKLNPSEHVKHKNKLTSEEMQKLVLKLEDEFYAHKDEIAKIYLGLPIEVNFSLIQKMCQYITLMNKVRAAKDKSIVVTSRMPRKVVPPS